MGTLSRFSEADASQIEDGSHECNVPKLPLSGTLLSQPSDQGPTEVPVPMMDPMATPTIPAAAAPGSTPNTSLISSRLRSSQKGTPTQGNSGAARRVCLATREIVSLDPMHEHSCVARARRRLVAPSSLVVPSRDLVVRVMSCQSGDRF